MGMHDKAEIIKMFRSGGCSVVGAKGSGKDLLFQFVIKRREKDGEIHASNICYTDKTTIHHPAFYTLEKNTIDNFITGEFEKEEKKFTEKEDYYLSDAETALPSWAHHSLEKNKQLKNFPVVMELSRHLGNFNIHYNAQWDTMVWDKLRGHSSYWFQCEKAHVFKLPFIRLVDGHLRYSPILLAHQKMLVYNRHKTAEEHILPYVVIRNWLGIPNKDSLIQAENFNAKYGVVKRFNIWHILPPKPYDTREFHNKIFGYPAPNLDSKKDKKKKTQKKDKEKKTKTND